MDIEDIYNELLDHFGPQDWWPGDTPFEIVIGAILTQNTNWRNVEKAIGNLKEEGVLSAQGLHGLSEEHIASLIRPAGYFNVKAKRVKDFLRFLFNDHGGDLDTLFSLSQEDLRNTLLDVKGIGPETADSMVLYAAQKPSFVVDAYTKRIFSRLDLVDEKASYNDVKEIFETELPRDTHLYNEYHALIVALGKNMCKPKPLCVRCPLKDRCRFIGEKVS